MTTQDFLRELRALDVQIWLEGASVRCSAPPGVLTPERRSELSRRRPEIRAVLQAAGRLALPTSIVPIERRGSRLPFYGVPGHNGDVFCFVRLAREIGPDQPFFGLQPPGLAAGSTPLARIEDLAEHFVEAVLRHQPRGPYRIGGYCLGGFVAFEIARRLRAKGHEVATVVLFGTVSPAALRPLNRAEAAARTWLANRVSGMRRFVSLTAAERRRHLRSRLARWSNRAVGSAADETSVRRHAVEQATIAAALRYRPAPYDGTLALFVPAAAAVRSTDRPLEWDKHARSTDVVVGPDGCDGDSMLKDPAVEVFAEHLDRYLRHAPAALSIRG